MAQKATDRTLSNFFLDGAKIIFGALVVGLFAPTANRGVFPWLTFITGTTFTGFFLTIAIYFTEKKISQHDTY